MHTFLTVHINYFYMKEIKISKDKINNMYNEFITNDDVEPYINKKQSIIETDEKRDEVYYSKEKHLDVFMKGTYIKNQGDVLYGFRIRLNDYEGLPHIKSILSKYNYNESVIVDVSDRFDCIEVNIELFDPHNL